MSQSREPIAAPTPAGQQEAATGSGSLRRGLGRSPGVSQGVAYTAVGELDIQRLSAEHILVCVSGLPYRIDWLSVYLSVRGIVVCQASGAALHHALQLAREFGIPYVELPEGGADGIATGAQIRIDGAAGTVELVDPPR